MSTTDARITLSVAFSLTEILYSLGAPRCSLYDSTDELVAALDDVQVQRVLAVVITRCAPF
jgi:hypothetical protein